MRSARSSKPSPAWRPRLRSDPWSTLWSQTDRGAIDLEADDPVARALRDHWGAHVHWLGRCAIVADVGSGPAVLPRMLMTRAGQALSGVHWICLDEAEWPAAAAAAAAAWPGARLTFRTGQSFTEASPPALGVGALVSNFGLEYVPMDGAVAACRAWLAGGARLQAVMHARDSVIDRAGAGNLADIVYALRDLDLFGRAGAMLQAMASAPADPMERMMHGIEVRDAYNAAVNALKARMEAAGDRSAPVVDMLQGIVGLTRVVQQGRVDEAMQALQRRASDYADECRRLEAMRDAALDADGLARWLEAMTAAGLSEPRAEPLTSSIGPIAWSVSARKP